MEIFMKKIAVTLMLSLLFGSVAFAEVKSTDSQQVKYRTGNYDFKTDSATVTKTLSDKNVYAQKEIAKNVKSDKKKAKKLFFKSVNDKKQKAETPMPVQFQIIEMNVKPQETRTFEKL